MADNKLTLKCKPRQARQHIIDCIEAGLVPFLQGSPGIGKSTISRGISKDYLLKLIDHRVSTSEPTDASGLPRFGADGFAYYAPFADIFPLDHREVPEGYNGWMLFLDEFNAATKQTQVAFYKLVLDRMVGQHKLHPNVAIVMAGNLATDRAVVNALSTAMQSRVIHLELEVSYDEWLMDVALPEHYDNRVIAFLSQFMSKLMDFKPDHHEKTFCCPRTWEFVNRLITTPEFDSKNRLIGRTRKPVENMGALLSGTITSGVAMEFIQFCKVYENLITIQDIRQNPSTCRIPTDMNLKWATVSHMMEKISDENFRDLATYANRFDLSFRILFYRSILIRKPELRTHPDFGPNAQKIAKYLFDPSPAAVA